jgi:hypothetical protein
MAVWKTWSGWAVHKEMVTRVRGGEDSEGELESSVRLDGKLLCIYFNTHSIGNDRALNLARHFLDVVKETYFFWDPKADRHLNGTRFEIVIDDAHVRESQARRALVKETLQVWAPAINVHLIEIISNYFSLKITYQPKSINGL